MSITLNTDERNSNPWAKFTLSQRLIESGAYDLRKYRKIIGLGNGYSRVEPMWTDDRQPRYGDDEETSEYRHRLRNTEKEAITWRN